MRTTMPNVLVTGSNGQLGSEIRELTQHSALNTKHFNFHFTDKNILDITNKDAIESFCYINNIEVIINCAAYTAVDRAEKDTLNADKINHLAVKYLAEISKEQNIKLIHISTDYVFDGTNYKPYTETDTVDPQGVYGKTKLDGEKAMLAINPENSVIIRTSWVYSTLGSNFVKTMLRLGKERDELGVIYDQVGTPTYARDLADTLLRMLSDECLVLNDNVEIYNYSNEGVSSWYDFAKAIFELSDIDCNIKPIETKEYPTPAQRPHYSLLNKSKIKEHFKLAIPYWKDSLESCLKKMGELK